MTSRITISLISLNQAHHLRRLLPTLEKSVQGLDARILMVANRCVDDSVEYVRKNYPQIDILENPGITGYGGNHNLNLERSDSEYFVIMNSDMMVKPDTFKNIIAFMKTDEKLGIVAPKVLNEDGSIQYLNKRYPSVFDLFLRKFCPLILQRFFRDRMDAYEMKDTDYSTVMDVPLLSGSFLFCRSDLLKKLAGFDEQFFLYFEDYDLCRRFQLAGYRTVFYPEAEAVHFWERSAHKSWKFALMFINSARKYFCRWGWKLH